MKGCEILRAHKSFNSLQEGTRSTSKRRGSDSLELRPTKQQRQEEGKGKHLNFLHVWGGMMSRHFLQSDRVVCLQGRVAWTRHFDAHSAVWQRFCLLEFVVYCRKHNFTR